MFLLNNKPISLDSAFTTDDGTQYPNNWIRLASPEERAAIGITEVDDAPTYDDRFYWGVGLPKALEDKEEVDQDGNPMFVMVLGEVDGKPAMVPSANRLVAKGLKSQMIAQIKATAGSLLSASDWKIIRAAETNTSVNADVLVARAAIRAASNANESAINACVTVDELAVLQFNWPTEK